MVATIGYEGASLEDFIATLKISKIDTLIDIRDRAQSRRPGFSKSTLSEALSAEGIAYRHMKELGDPKEGREAMRRGDYKGFEYVFSMVMNTNAAKMALAEIAALSANFSVCLMCFERDQKHCHRKIVADTLSSDTGIKVQHLGVAKGAGKRCAA